MNPLNAILNWFNLQGDNIQYDFVAIAAHFHLDNSIELEIEKEKKIKKFKSYLEDSDLSDKEVIQRTMFLKSLINFTLDGRNSEEGWEWSRKLMEAIYKKLKSKGKDFGVYDNLMIYCQERKEKWISWAKDWDALISGELTDKKIGDWYFFKI